MQRGEHAYQQLKQLLMEDRFPPGAPLPELALCEELGTSRTPVREALQRLAREQFVRIIPGRGAFVAEISIPDMVELFQLREALEPYAAALAARSEPTDDLRDVLARLADARRGIRDGRVSDYYVFTARIDEVITAQAGNRRLAAELQLVWAQIQRHRRVAATNEARLLDSVDEHEEILRAIIARDEDAAASAARRHVQHSLANLMATVVPR